MIGFRKIALVVFILLAGVICQGQGGKKALPDTTQIKNTITGFYKWYTANWQKVTAFKLYKGQKQKDQPPYRIDWKEAERYFSYLRKNATHLSEEFIDRERQRLKSSEEEFKKYPDDELPAGFDYDPFTNSQEEPSYFVKELGKKTNRWNITIKNERAFVVVETQDAEQPHIYSHLFCGDVIKANGKWKIARVDCDIDIAP